MRTDEGARAVKRAHSGELLGRPGIVGFGVEHDEGGQPVRTIHVDSDDSRLLSSLPSQIDEYPVKIIVQPGGFRAYNE